MPRVVVFSIKPHFAARIFEGEKDIELRRVRLNVHPGDIAVVYASSPRSSVVGAFVVRGVVVDDVARLWAHCSNSLGVTHDEYARYFAGASAAYGVLVGERVAFDPVPLETLRRRVPDFRPPQSYLFWGRSLEDLVPPDALATLRRHELSEWALTSQVSGRRA